MRFSPYNQIQIIMEKLDSMILQDIKEQMYFCTGLAVQYVKFVSSRSNVDNGDKYGGQDSFQSIP